MLHKQQLFCLIQYLQTHFVKQMSGRDDESVNKLITDTEYHADGVGKTLTSTAKNIEESAFDAQKTDKLFNTYFLLFRNFIGISSLGLPYLVQEVGLYYGLAILAVAVLIIYYGNALFCYVADKAGFEDKRMESLMKIYFGDPGYYVTAFLVLIVQACLFVNTFVIYADYFTETFCDQVGWEFTCVSRTTVLLAFFFLEAPLVAFIKHMQFFSYLALPSAIALLTIYGLNIIHGIVYIVQNGVNETTNYYNTTVLSSALYFGGLCFSIEGVTNLIPIRSTMLHPRKFPTILIFALLGIFVALCSLVLALVLSFGGDIPELSMIAFQEMYPYLIVPNMIFVLTSIFFKPIDLMIIFFFMEESCGYKNTIGKIKNQTTVLWINRLLKVVICFCLVGIGIFLDSFAEFMEYTGSLFFPFVNFVFPIFLYLKACQTTFLSKVFNLLLCFFGFSIAMMAALDKMGMFDGMLEEQTN